MGDFSGENTLTKIALFCIAMSVMSTCLVTVYVAGSSDYDYDTISAYRSELTTFSGGQLVNDNPWILTAVYTPFVPSEVAPQDIPDHIERDGGNTVGWLFGQNVTTYQYIGEAAEIKLDPFLSFVTAVVSDFVEINTDAIF